MVNLVHPETSKILDDQLRPESQYRTRRGRGRPTTRCVTTSSSALADAMKGGELTPGGKGGEGGGRHEEIIAVTVPPMVTAPSTDELILANGAKLQRWDAYNNQLYSILLLSNEGAANSLLVCFAEGPTRGNNRTSGRLGRQWPKNTSIRQCSGDVF